MCRYERSGRKTFVGTAVALFCLLVAGCGGGGGGNSLSFGFRQSGAARISLTTAPRPNLSVSRPTVNPGTGPAIVLDSVAPYSGVVHPEGSGIYESVTQFVSGRAFNADRARTRIVVYAQTNQFYIQPLDGSFSEIRDGGIWFAPAHNGRILALLVADTFEAPATYPTNAPPQADGVNILATVQQP